MRVSPARCLPHTRSLPLSAFPLHGKVPVQWSHGEGERMAKFRRRAPRSEGRISSAFLPGTNSHRPHFWKAKSRCCSVFSSDIELVQGTRRPTAAHLKSGVCR